MSKAQPAAERAMLAQIRSRFVRRNERLLRAFDSAAVDACLAAQSLSDLLAAHAPFAMRRRGATGDEYFAAHDPMAVRRNVSVPAPPLQFAGRRCEPRLFTGRGMSRC